MLVVTPFENRSGDTADAYLAATLTEDVTSALGATHAVRLLSPRGSRRGTELVLGASVRRTGGAVRVAARLERAGSGEIVWTTSLDRPAAQTVGAADTLAARVLARLGVRRALAARELRPTDPAVYDLYLRGRYLVPRRSQADLARAVSLLSQAVARDSGFAPAWAALARAYHFAYRWRFVVPGAGTPESLLAREIRASERALELDSTSSEAWLTRAVVAEDVDPTSRSASVRALRRAVAVDSLNAAVWTQLGIALGETGDSSAGLAALRRAVATDPGYADGLVWLANFHYWRRQHDSAAVWADSAIATDPTFLQAYRSAGNAALARGRLEEAEARFAAAARLGPGAERIVSLAGLAAVAAARRDTAQARLLMREAQATADSSELSSHTAVFLAWGCAALGENDRALAWLERFRPRGDLHFQLHLRGDSPLDPLRADPRFRALVGQDHD